MPVRGSRTARLVALVLPALFVLAGGCHVALTSEAHDEWKRSYPLSHGGTVQIDNTNGEIRVEPADTDTVEVTATRTARATSDEDARNALRRIQIDETVTPDKVVLDSSRGGMAFEINVSRKVDYVVRVPRGATVTLSTTNGEIVARGVEGAFRAESTNGSITATELAGAVHLETTNGDITADLGRVADAGVSCETTNGDIHVSVPASAAASFEAETTNGDIDTGGLNLAVSDQSRKHLKATIGGGGPAITLSTTNGGILVKGK